MKLISRTGMRLGTLLRVLIDATLSTLALWTVLVAHYFVVTLVGDSPTPTSDALATLRSAAVLGPLILTSVSLNIFYLSGFYRRNRTYQARYKIRAIVEAVTASQLVFAFALLMLWNQVDFPRAVLIPNWLLTMALMVFARVYVHRLSLVSRLLIRVEALDSPHAQPVERVLVVGGGGYIGSALLRKLLDKGYRVRLLDFLMFGEEPIADLLTHPNLELVREDFRQVHHVVRAMSGVDAVIHLGAIVGDPACALDEKLTIDTNLVATQMVAEVAKAAGVQRFVFASTCSVYGAGDEILDEQSELNPVSLYAQSKIACEEVLAEMATPDFSPVFLRFGTIYGLSGRTRFDLVVNLLTAKALVDGEITVFGGDQWRPFLHVDDAATSVLLALEAPKAVAHGQVFNVGCDEQNYTIDEVGELIQSMVPGAEIKQMGNDGDRRDYRVNFSRIRSELGFKPAWTVPMGIRQVIDAINSGEVVDYSEARYSNVKSLKERQVIDLRPLDDNTGIRPKNVVYLQYNLQFGSGAWTLGLVSDTDEVAHDYTNAVSSAGEMPVAAS